MKKATLSHWDDQRSLKNWPKSMHSTNASKTGTQKSEKEKKAVKVYKNHFFRLKNTLFSSLFWSLHVQRRNSKAYRPTKNKQFSDLHFQETYIKKAFRTIQRRILKNVFFVAVCIHVYRSSIFVLLLLFSSFVSSFNVRFFKLRFQILFE